MQESSTSYLYVHIATETEDSITTRMSPCTTLAEIDSSQLAIDHELIPRP